MTYRSSNFGDDRGMTKMMLLPIAILAAFSLHATCAIEVLDVRRFHDPDSLMEAYFKWRVTMFPSSASGDGIHDHDDKIRDNSPVGYK